MGIYYKATTLGGFDFRTETVDYAGHLASGDPLPLLTAESYECCTNTVYHASETPSETLVGCSWPCRLFEVEGSPVAQENHKFGFRAFTVVREIEAWRALGPNGEDVVALIERAKSLTDAEVFDLSAVRNAARNAAWSAAGDDAWDAVRNAVRNAARNAAGNAARRAARNAARNAAWNAAWNGVREVEWGAAGIVAGDAAYALVVRDLIPARHFNVMYGPWDSVINKK